MDVTEADHHHPKSTEARYQKVAMIGNFLGENWKIIRGILRFQWFWIGNMDRIRSSNICVPGNKGADDFQWLWSNAWNTGRDYGVNMSRSNAEWSVMRESYICCCLCESNLTFSNTYLFKDNFHISVQFSMKLVPKGLIENNSAYEAMVLGRQAASQCLSHCRSGSLSPYGATRPQWVSLFTYWNLAATK